MMWLYIYDPHVPYVTVLDYPQSVQVSAVPLLSTQILLIIRIQLLLDDLCHCSIMRDTIRHFDLSYLESFCTFKALIQCRACKGLDPPRTILVILC